MGGLRVIKGGAADAVEVEGSKGSCFIKPILSSISVRTKLVITTMHIRVPRIIWPEILTHRVLSRNARSSRAVPERVMLEEIQRDPFVPWHWTRIQQGMQGEAGHDNPVVLLNPKTDLEEIHSNERAWLLARDSALGYAKAFAGAGYHKQIFNRIVEPYMWIDGLITTVTWNNLLWLRDDDAAEPHLRDIAVAIKQVLDSAKPQQLDDGDWHLPYIAAADYAAAADRFPRMSQQNEWLRKISAARCARMSYVPFNGEASYEAELQRYLRLTSDARLHASPMEHQATPDFQLADGRWARPELHGNLLGFVQGRKLDPREFVAG